MTLRSPRERLFQTLCFEVGGLALVTPAYVLLTGSSKGEGLVVIVILALAVMIWSPIHNSLWDWIEHRRTGRVASDRPQAQRIVHALSHEVTTVIVTLPLLMLLGGHDFWTALLLDLGLSLFYAGYAYVFHVIYDRLRPIRPLPRPEVRP